MFFDIFEALCKESKVAPSRVALDIGLNKSTVSMWKKHGLSPNTEALQKIADYFQVPPAFLLGTGPFRHWEAINNNRAGFFRAVSQVPGISRELLPDTLDVADADAISLAELVRYIDTVLESVATTEDGGFTMVVKPMLLEAQTHKAPPDSGNSAKIDRIMQLLQQQPEAVQTMVLKMLEAAPPNSGGSDQ
ncbi:MAG: helix-turn-helix transcriptional regulator [Ruminococcaceae bacterium]|nr:helix-turn-helix transcriptional regulator [Oscillospiraceae bacterium]